MSDLCSTCASPLVEGFCPSCDVADVEFSVDQPASVQEPADPLIGRVIADRYEIRALHGTGGMARIYRAVQRSLEREVVIKVINPDLLAQDELTAEEATARFMVEAQAASRLNHPNVVSVFDFGQTAPSEGGLLFLVMEYLTGRDLWTIHHEDLAMPFPRIANILQQTLSALGEAHYVGMAHRDVKPENILLETTRSGRDLVKVIDFGLAKLHALQSVTRVGQTLGTPHYMAPEQIAGAALGSADLYAVGIILFELLTGELPFDGATPIEILKKHLEAPRPDPRDVAPHRNIPAALASVCMRAMHVDPQQRWPDAESLSAAIVRAVGSTEWASRASTRPPAPGGERAIARMTAPVRPIGGDAPLFGRDAELRWADEILSRRGRAQAINLHGPTGVGRSRLLREIATAAEDAGAHVVRARGAGSPRREVSYAGLREIVASLTRLGKKEARLTTGQEAGRDADAAMGLRIVFGGHDPGAGADTRRRVAAAFAWAMSRALAQASGASVVLAIDDADQLDRASRLALRDGLAIATASNVSLVATSAAPLDFPPDRTRLRAIGGLAMADAAKLAEWLGSPPGIVLGGRRGGTIEPLFLELLRRWKLDGAPPPARLNDLVELGLRGLSPSQRRLLLAFAITGAESPDELGSLARRQDVDTALGPLIDSGLLHDDGQGSIRIAHEIFSVLAIGTAPGAAVAQLHAAAADARAGAPDLGELRAHHAVRGSPDFETFLLVEECAAARTRAGDDEGAVEMLHSGLLAGRRLLQHGDLESGGSAVVVFGQKLGAALRALERYSEAIGALRECLDLVGPRERGRAVLLEELSRAAGSQGMLREAAVWRNDALTIARQIGDAELVRRLVALARE
jgi:serine/threonine-protein kinase